MMPFLNCHSNRPICPTCARLCAPQLHWCLLYAQGYRAEHNAPPIRRIVLPRQFNSDPRPVLSELELLLNGTCIAVNRLVGVPACGPEEACCANRTAEARVSSPADVAQLQVGFFDAMPPAARPAFRLHVWRNLGIEHAAANSVTFVRSEGASSGRRIGDEKAVVQRVRTYFAARRPRLQFVHQPMAELPYRDELQLFRRSAVFISLFGSSLHNCRFLPPERRERRHRAARRTQAELGTSQRLNPTTSGVWHSPTHPRIVCPALGNPELTRWTLLCPLPHSLPPLATEAYVPSRWA
jgi:hypothetical protein